MDGHLTVFDVVPIIKHRPYKLLSMVDAEKKITEILYLKINFDGGVCATSGQRHARCTRITCGRDIDPVDKRNWQMRFKCKAS